MQIQLSASAGDTAPTLDWTGEGNYTADGLNPETGNTVTTFVYRVKYTDADNDAPASGYPKVHIKKSGSEITGSPFTMAAVDAGDSTYSDGKLYTYSKTLATIGTDYTYYFEAQDANSAAATGTPTSVVAAPNVSDILSGAQQENFKTTLGDNLFNPRTGGTSKIKFNVPTPGRVSLKIYDLSGKLIRTLFESDSNSGDTQQGLGRTGTERMTAAAMWCQACISCIISIRAAKKSGKSGCVDEFGARGYFSLMVLAYAPLVMMIFEV